MSTDVTPSGATLTQRVAEEIRVAMVRKRMSGAGLARALGVSPAWISYRLTGSQPIDLNDLERLAVALEVEVVDLLPRAVADVARTLGYLHSPLTHPRGHDRPQNRPAGRASGPGRTSRTRPPVAA